MGWACKSTYLGPCPHPQTSQKATEMWMLALHLVKSCIWICLCCRLSSSCGLKLSSENSLFFSWAQAGSGHQDSHSQVWVHTCVAPSWLCWTVRGWVWSRLDSKAWFRPLVRPWSSLLGVSVWNLGEVYEHRTRRSSVWRMGYMLLGKISEIMLEGEHWGPAAPPQRRKRLTWDPLTQVVWESQLKTRAVGIFKVWCWGEC